MGIREAILRRARARRETRGAAIFIVAVTLALLASMGVYGMTSTSNDIAAAGYLRQSTQAQHVDEAAVMGAAESITPATAAKVLSDMYDATNRSNQTVAGTGRCRSANAPSSDSTLALGQACKRLTPAEMQLLTANLNKWVATDLFASDSLGNIPQQPTVSVEITNPVEVPGPAGNSSNGGTTFYFAQVTATVYADLRKSASDPIETSVLGRAQLTVGPYLPSQR